jgi:quercetin dioxygenase-like cupin family protein
MHKHYGNVVLYTIKGAWRYLEHDWVSRAGDFVYETAGSSHSFFVEPGETTYLDYCEQEGLEPVDMTRFDEVKIA